jgi:serine/threonine-protein kinase RsbW
MTRPKVRFCLVFERELLSVPVMRQVLGDTLRGIGVNEDSVADILLAATEACTNVVLHAGQSAPAYTVAATVDNAACRVEVTDAGQGCSRRWRGRLRRSGDLAESGRGFAIMRACVDGVTLRSSPGRGTRVVLDKRIDWEAQLSPGGTTPRTNTLILPLAAKQISGRNAKLEYSYPPMSDRAGLIAKTAIVSGQRERTTCGWSEQVR